MMSDRNVSELQGQGGDAPTRRFHPFQQKDDDYRDRLGADFPMAQNVCFF